jgi:hypothetical protein
VNTFLFLCLVELSVSKCEISICFSKDKQLIDPLLSRNLFFHRAECVTITFVDQKSGRKCETCSQVRTAGHPVLCPVLIWGRIIRRILGTYTDSDVNTWYNPTRQWLTKLTNTELPTLLRESCRLGGGKEKYGYAPLEIGTHSIMSSAAMLALFFGQ